MRIEINGNGGVVASYQNKLDTLYDRINDTIEALQKVNRDISDVNGVKNGNLQLAQSSIDSRILIEENKRDKVFRLQQQSNTFFDHAVEVDKKVATTIEQNEKKFYEKHPHLAPVPLEQKIWDWLCEQWEKFCDGAEKIWDGIVAFVKEHAVELIVGAVTLAIAAVLTFISGGALLPLVVGVLKGMLVSGLFSAAISAFTGGDIMDAFFDGLADGFMWGGIFALAANIVNVVKNILKFGKISVADDVANVADDVVNSADDAKNVADDAVNSVDDGLETLSPPSSKVLRQNMIDAGVKVPDYPNAAHHIVAGSSSNPAAKSARAILKKFRIDINDAANGVFLPTAKGVVNSAYHPALHTDKYYRTVTEMLSQATSKDDVLDILADITEQLVTGVFKY